MKIIFYSVKDFELPYLETAAAGEPGILFLPESLNAETASQAKGFDIISTFTGDDASAPVLEILYQNGVRYIATRAAGYDNIDIKKANELGIAVANVPEYSPYAIAEHAVALTLALNRKIVLADRQVHDYNFTTAGLIGFDLHGKTVGIIGVGRIGAAFANIMHGFGCRLLGYDIAENEVLREQYGLKYVDLPTLCREADLISIHTNLSPETKYMINKTTIGLMKKGVILINTSRGACVNTAEVIEGLKDGSIGYYGADVYEREKGLFFFDHSGNKPDDALLKQLLSLPNVLLTPHQAFATKEALTNITDTTFHHIHCWRKKQRSEFELTQAHPVTEVPAYIDDEEL
jgi:D-lactate dehydrogenase